MFIGTELYLTRLMYLLRLQTGLHKNGVRGGWFVVVLVHGLLVILDSRFFSSVEVRRFVGIYTMGELKLIGRVEVYRQVGRRAVCTLQIKKSLFVPTNFSSGDRAIVFHHLLLLLDERL